jgi:hypothetical protein
VRIILNSGVLPLVGLEIKKIKIKKILANMLKLVARLLLSRSGSNSVRVQVSLFVFICNICLIVTLSFLSLLDGKVDG